MCDCYQGKCVDCGCWMQIHIGDFCTERENIHPYCHRCTKKHKGELPSKFKDFHLVFHEKIGRVGPYGQVEGGKKGQNVMIVCEDRKAYGIHLN